MTRRRIYVNVGASVALVALAMVVAVRSTPPAAGAGPGPQIQQVSSDPYTNSFGQHETEAEPDTFAYGDTIVSAFQVGRTTLEAGSMNNGWATSTDGGKTWTHGFLPLTVFSSPAGPYYGTSDPAVAYDSTDGVWMISSLVGTLVSFGPPLQISSAIVVSRSPDGLNWGAPVIVSSSATLQHDKEWIVCDNSPSSPYAGRCYISWVDFVLGGLVTSTSTDGGQTWGAPVIGGGYQLVVQPNGTLVALVPGGAMRSTDGGASFGALALFDSPTYHFPNGLRGCCLNSAEIDGAGKVYDAWPDCRFRAGCSADDIVMSTSGDGVTWSSVVRIPIDDVTSGVEHFLPGLAVDPATQGANAHLALTYYYLDDAACAPTTCLLNVGFIYSKDAGASWSWPRRLNDQPMPLSWLAVSNGGFVGDYISTSFVDGRAITVVPIATEPGSTLHQAMYAAVDALDDFDGDGCPDVNEQQTAGLSEFNGGRRDYLNPYDFFNPTNDGKVRVDDILAVVGRYFSSGDPAGPLNTIPPPPPAYHPKFDRAPLGPNVWNLTQGNGIVTIPDILAVIAQYFHDCGSGITKVP